jgi:phytoene dehydrogenase-like protein
MDQSSDQRTTNRNANGYEAIVIGSGPNGLAAAITLAQAGHSVLVVEAEQTIGGGMRSLELTLPGFVHDICSAVHPTAVASPFFQTLPLAEHGLKWIYSAAQAAHPLDDGTAVIADRSIEATAAGLGRSGDPYMKMIGPLVADWPKLQDLVLGPIGLPKHPFAAARFGMLAWRSAFGLAKSVFKEERARAMFAGMAAHSILPLDQLPTGAFAVIFCGTVHAVGWPIAQGGSQKLADALVSYLRSLGGEVVTGWRVESLDEFPKAKAILCDVAPRALAKIAGARLPDAFRQKLENYRHGPGVCKLDWALDGPIPWKAQECLRAATVHVGGTLEEIAESERAPWNNQLDQRPFVLLSQPTLFDTSRAPAGKHTAWAYCHVPNGSSADVSEQIENQVERFAPGFRERILGRSVIVASKMSDHNANLVGGDVVGGANTLEQLIFRPTARLYRTPAKGIYICSASTPPGGGVHGMCGHIAARAAIADVWGQ